MNESHAAPSTGAVQATVYRLLGLLIALALGLIVVLTFADVFMRYFFASPIRGSVEIIEYAMAIVIFSALPLVTRDRGHVCVSLIDGVVKGRYRRLKSVICDALSGLALGMMAWQLWGQANEAAGSGASTLVLGWPIAPLYYAMSALAAIATLATIGLMGRSQRDPASGQ